MRYDVKQLSLDELINIISKSDLSFNNDICKIIWEYYKSPPNKQQYVKVDDIITTQEGNILYSYYYGVYGYHEGYCTRENIRELTPTEKIESENNRFWKLPQQFYQSFPE